MKFDEKELATLIAKKIDKIVFQSKGQSVLQIDIEDLIKKELESNETLKKQLLQQVLL